MERQLAEWFAEANLSSAEFRLRPKPGPPTPLRTFMSTDTVMTIAVDREGRRLNRIEAECRRWARGIGVPSPAVLRSSPSGAWLLAERAITGEPRGQQYVEAALGVAERIAGGASPPLSVSASTWRAPRWNVPVRAARTALGGLSPAAFIRLRRAARDLPAESTSHGDFYRRNVLPLAAGGVSIVDWEFIGPAPRFTDHLRLWSTLRDPHDRSLAWEHIDSLSARSGHQAHVRTLAAWLAARLLAENLAAPARHRNKTDLTHARAVAAEGIQLTGP